MTTSVGAGPEQAVSKPEVAEARTIGQEGGAGKKATSLARRERMEHALKRAERTVGRIGDALERPLVGASVAGGLVAAAAGLWGPTEALLGAAAGLVAYRALRRRRGARLREQPAPVSEPATSAVG